MSYYLKLKNNYKTNKLILNIYIKMDEKYDLEILFDAGFLYRLHVDRLVTFSNIPPQLK